jgi:hypothetical protein
VARDKSSSAEIDKDGQRFVRTGSFRQPEIKHVTIVRPVLDIGAAGLWAISGGQPLPFLHLPSRTP